MKKALIFLLGLVILSTIFLIFKSKSRLLDQSLKKPIGLSLFDVSSSTLKTKEVILAFTGEMIFARTVAFKINQVNDYRLPFYQVKPILAQADLRIGTLEAPFIGKNNPCGVDCMVFQADEENISGLKYADINVVTLATNHIMDAGSDGLKKTIELLDESNISHVGAGLSENFARLAVIKEINGQKFGFLGYNNVPPKEYSAALNSAGSAWLENEKLIADIKKLRPQVDILIVLCHWGIEYTDQPNLEQKELAHLAVDHGVDLIIGDHPHWIQAVEFYKDKLIFYGLGNFVFDQMWSEETQKGMIVLLSYQNKNLKGIEIVPFRIYDYVQPRPMVGEEKEKMRKYILSLSDKESREKLFSLLSD